MKKKELISLLLVGAISLSACSTNGENGNAKNNSSSKEELEKLDQVEDLNIIEPIVDDVVKEQEPITDELPAEVDLSTKQKNSIAMLNYLAMISQEINDSKESRLYLEEVYSSLVSNTNPDKIDEMTQEHISNLLDIIEEYRMISIKRSRLEYLYNQDKARQIRNAIPNPLAVLSVAGSLDFKRMAIATVYTAVDSFNNYKKAGEELDRQFTINGWELEDGEQKQLHLNRKRTFNYMLDIVQENELPGNLTMSEESVRDYVTFCNQDTFPKLEYLESNEDIYGFYANYWLDLLDCYYELGQYDQCVLCAEKYNELYTGVFRRDYEYAERLPKVLVSIQELYDGEKFIIQTNKYVEDLNRNSKKSDWSKKYFAALIYIELYNRTNDLTYLQKAYDIALYNVNILAPKQKDINDIYLSEVIEKQLDKEDRVYSDKEEKKQAEKKRKEEEKQLKKYNKELKNLRKTELPSLYEPLVLNCDLLFGLAKKLNVNENEKMKIEGILKTKNNGIFLTKPINDAYSFSNKKAKYKIQIEKDKLVIPAQLLTDNYKIKVRVGKKTYSDWNVTAVNREGKNISKFKAELISDKYSRRKWNENENVVVEIYNRDNYKPVKMKFKVTSVKDRFIISDSVEFRQL